MLGRFSSDCTDSVRREIKIASSIRFTVALFSVKFDVIKIVHIVERSNADASLAVGLINNAHMRLGHVVEVYLYSAFFCISDDFDFVPCFIFPRSLVLVVCHGLAWRVLNYHDLTTVGVGVSAKVAVIKMLSILPIEKYAAITMATGIFGAFNVESKLEVSYLDVLN